MTKVVRQPRRDIDICGCAVAARDLDADLAVGDRNDADPLPAVGMANLHARPVLGVFEVSYICSLAVVGRDAGLFRHIQSTEGVEIA